MKNPFVLHFLYFPYFLFYFFIPALFGLIRTFTFFLLPFTFSLVLRLPLYRFVVLSSLPLTSFFHFNGPCTDTAYNYIETFSVLPPSTLPGAVFQRYSRLITEIALPRLSKAKNEAQRYLVRLRKCSSRLQ